MTAPQQSDAIKSIFAGFGLIVFLLIVAFVAVTMWKAPIHQFNLWRLGRNFRAAQINHPENSKSVLQVRDFGNLFRAMSNGCDYLVGEVRASAVSPEEIRRRYEGAVIQSFDHTGSVLLEIEFFDKKDWIEPYAWSDWGDRARAYGDPVAQGETLYMVFARQTDYPPDGDIRCG